MEPNDTIKAQLLDARDLERTLHRMARQLVEMFALDEDGGAHFALIGMQTRGVHLGRRLQQIILPGCAVSRNDRGRLPPGGCVYGATAGGEPLIGDLSFRTTVTGMD